MSESPEKCDDCAHLDSGFNWNKMEYTREPSCQFGNYPAVCDKFYKTEWLKDLEEDDE